MARQKQMGIVPHNTELSPLNPIGSPQTRTGPDGQPFPPLDVARPWESLADEEKRLFCRMAEAFAGFLAHADHRRPAAGLPREGDPGQAENTVVIVVSDNGASGEGGPNGSVNENKLTNGIPDDIASNLAQLEELGSPLTYNHYPNGWAAQRSTPVQNVEALRVQRRHR